MSLNRGHEQLHKRRYTMADASSPNGARAQSDSEHKSDSDSDSDSRKSFHFLSDDSYTHDSRDRGVYAARPKLHWKFLTKWFRRVAGRCSISDADRADSHPVRIGREMDDMWIDVRVSTTEARVDPAWRAAELRSAREGLLLLATLAQVDYKSWIGGMMRKTGFSVPQYLELQHCPEIAREFCFFFNSFLEPLHYQWDVLQHLMGDDNFSDEFTQDLAKIVEIAKAQGRNVPEFDIIPVKLALEPEGSEGKAIEQELDILRGVTHTVREMLVISERNRRADGGVRVRPCYCFDSVELNLRGFTMHPQVLDAIRELLETGVRVKTLALPEQTQHDVDQKWLRGAWTEFVVTALGHRLLESGRAAQLDRLEVPGCYMTDHFLIPLCSALRDTRVLKALTLNFDGFHEVKAASQRRLWKWIDFALFSPTPTNSVATLEFHFLKLRATAHSQLAGSGDSVDPIGDLWKAVTGQRDQSSDSPHTAADNRAGIRIASDTTISARGVQGRGAKFVTTSTHTGVVIGDDMTKPTLDSFVPGLGFYQVPREHTTPCDAPAVHGEILPQHITTLVQISHSMRFDGQDDEYGELMRTFFGRLLEFAGPSLTALALGCDILDATDIATISQSCPHLKSLRLRGATVDSMDAFTTLYANNTDCRISSLDLSHLHVPIEAFENFLTTLTPQNGPHPIQRKLERLRIGKGYSGTFRAATRQAIMQLLRGNRMLTHLIVFRKARAEWGRRYHAIFGGGDSDSDSDDDDGGSDRWVVYNGGLLPSPPLALDRRIAFISVVRALASQNRAGGQLGSDVLQLIFSFATERVWRRAFVERDVDSELLDFMREDFPALFA
jgi:hypothetical protein